MSCRYAVNDRIALHESKLPYHTVSVPCGVQHSGPLTSRSKPQCCQTSKLVILGLPRLLDPSTSLDVSHAVFAALHGMQTQSSDENSVCPSVKRVICDKTKE